MYCKHCGKELDENIRFCPACGTEQKVASQVDEEIVSEATAEQVAPESVAAETTAEVAEEPKQPKVWRVFSIIGKVLGIVSISICWIPFMLGFSLGIPGIVFSCLGKKYHTPETDKNFKVGLTLSIIGLVGSLLSYIIYVIVVMVIGMRG